VTTRAMWSLLKVPTCPFLPPILLLSRFQSGYVLQRLPFLRPSGPIFQCIDNRSLQAQNIETWPFFGRVGTLPSVPTPLLVCCCSYVTSFESSRQKFQCRGVSSRIPCPDADRWVLCNVQVAYLAVPKLRTLPALCPSL